MPLFNLKKTEKEKDTKPINIFTKKKEKESESEIISGVLAKKDEEVGEKEKILGPLPELERKIIGSFDPSKRNLKIIRRLFTILVIFSFLVIGFFYAELNPKFDLLNAIRGPNTAQKLTNSENEIISMQTSINQKNYLLINFFLQELSYLSDNYAKARSEQSNPQNLGELQTNILAAYENAQKKWQEDMTVSNIPEELFKIELINTLQNELNQLKQETRTPAIITEINSYASTIKLLENQQLEEFFNKDIDTIKQNLPRDDAELFALTQEALTVLQNEFSNINSVKNNRIKWSIIVNEIEKITKSVDTLYNSGFFDELGGIQYSSYDFDASSNKIILNGKAKRDDGTTFTLIANLIDALEKSTLFYDADNRQYPKSGSEDKGYISSFRIELSLEGNYDL